MFGIGGFELFIILIFAFLIFGPDKLPQAAKTLGKAIGKFRSAQEEIKEQFSFDSILGKNEEASASTQNQGKTDTKRATESSTTKDRSSSFAERKKRYDEERVARKKSVDATATKVSSKKANNPSSQVPDDVSKEDNS